MTRSLSCCQDETMRDIESNTDAKGKDAQWPFVLLYAFMWAGMLGTTLNSDPIKLDYNCAVVLGLVAIMGVVLFLAIARFRRQTIIAFAHPTTIGNLAWHMFLLTGIVFISFLFFAAAVQIMILSFGISVFESGCDNISQRDVALFVWDAMAKGAFKFLAKYLHLPAEACAPNTASLTVMVTAQGIRWFTALVVVWYVIGFVRAWYARLRQKGNLS
jgi:hypothetical protein